MARRRRGGGPNRGFLAEPLAALDRQRRVADVLAQPRQAASGGHRADLMGVTRTLAAGRPNPPALQATNNCGPKGSRRDLRAADEIAAAQRRSTTAPTGRQGTIRVPEGLCLVRVGRWWRRRRASQRRMSWPSPRCGWCTGSVDGPKTAMFEGISSSFIHGPGATPRRSARMTSRPLAARRPEPGSCTVPDTCSCASTCSPAALRRSISSGTAWRQASNSRRLSKAATTTCRRSWRSGSYRVIAHDETLQGVIRGVNPSHSFKSAIQTRMKDRARQGWDLQDLAPSTACTSWPRTMTALAR